MIDSKGIKLRYKTTNWTSYNATLKALGALTIWLDKNMQWYAPASGKRGCQQVFSDAGVQFCLSIKCLFGLAMRQSLGLVQSLPRLAGLDWKAPDFSTVSRRQKTLQMQLSYRASTGAGARVRNEAVLACRRLGRCIWKKCTAGAWWRPRCTVSSGWARESCPAPLSVR